MVIYKKVYAYEKNQVSTLAVQGEQDSRTIVFSIYEKSEDEEPTTGQQTVNPMLDLTGYTATLYGVYGDGAAVSCPGTIATDPTTGVVSFTLTAAFTVYAESLDCAIVLTKTGEELKIIGITLNVQPFDESGDVPKRPQPISFYLGTAYTETLSLRGADGQPYNLSSGQSLVLTVKNGSTVIITKTVTANNGTSGEYDFDFAASDTSGLAAGTYTYSVMLLTDSIPVVKPSPFTLLEL